MQGRRRETGWYASCTFAPGQISVPAFRRNSTRTIFQGRRIKAMMTNILSRFLDILCVAGFVYLATFL